MHHFTERRSRAKAGSGHLRLARRARSWHNRENLLAVSHSQRTPPRPHPSGELHGFPHATPALLANHRRPGATSFFVNPARRRPAAAAARPRRRHRRQRARARTTGARPSTPGWPRSSPCATSMRTRSAPVIKRFPKARFVEDYRRLLEQPRDIDAVVIATPDHITPSRRVLAMRAGKHVYCEKPLAHSVHEVRAMMEAAAPEQGRHADGHADPRRRQLSPRRRDRAVGHARPGAARARLVLAPARRRLPRQGADAAAARAQLRPLARPGPAARLSAVPHPATHGVHFDWRWWWDFGGGVLADMACHFMDLPHWALNLRHPTTRRRHRPGHLQGRQRHARPDAGRVRVSRARQPAAGAPDVVPRRQPGPDLDGKVTPPRLRQRRPLRRREGQPGRRLQQLPPAARGPLQGLRAARSRRSPRSVGHHREWLQAIQQRRRDDVQLRLLRRPRRDGAAGQRRLQGRRQDPVRRQDGPRHRRRRTRSSICGASIAADGRL